MSLLEILIYLALAALAIAATMMFFLQSDDAQRAQRSVNLFVEVLTSIHNLDPMDLKTYATSTTGMAQFIASEIGSHNITANSTDGFYINKDTLTIMPYQSSGQMLISFNYLTTSQATCRAIGSMMLNRPGTVEVEVIGAKDSVLAVNISTATQDQLAGYVASFSAACAQTSATGYTVAGFTT